MAAKTSSCRQRKLQCEDCGYVVRVTRAWMAEGLPTCHCGGRMLPTEPADLAYCELIGPDDMPAPQWTVICRENGWEDSIQRKGKAANDFNRRLLEAGGIMARDPGKPQCAYPGCGKWTADGAAHCHEHAAERELCPF